MALLGNLKGSAQVFQDTEFYNGIATQSLRFDGGGDLTRTPSSSGNQKTWTWSSWVKRALLADSQLLFGNRTNSSDVAWIYFNASNQFYFQNYEGSTQLELKTNALFRDVSSWYHVMVVLDTTQSTASNRAKLYVNGEQITSLATSTYPSQNADLKINTGSESHSVGSDGSDSYLKGYLSEVNFVDGLALDPTYFGETKNGVWVAKKYTGSYGTNGFRFEFKNTSVGSGSSSTIGADTSGNDNHFTSSNISAHDCAMPDSPENNWCTLNELDIGNSTTLGEGGLLSQQTADDVVTSTFHFDIATAKHYAEFYIMSSPGLSTAIGITESKVASDIKDVSGGNSGNYWYNANGQTRHTSYANYGNSFASGDIISIRIDEGSVYFYKNGTIQNSGTAAFSSLTGIYTISVGEYSGTNIQIKANFGQDSSFIGSKTAQGNTDDNGNGDFYYSPPSGHLALCSANLPEPTIGPNSLTQADDHFNTVTFSGTGSSPLSVTGVGFQPDWLWLKRRDNATNGHHIHYDSSRGGTNALRSSTQGAEAQFGDMVITFASDGFSFTGTDGLNASSSYSNVAWNWKANGGTTTTNDASATSVGSIDSDIQANTTAGFSIVQYETNSGTSGSSQTVAHGLSQAPTFMILKSRDQSGTSWMVYYGDNTDYLRLENSGATIDGQSTWNDTSPTSTVFSIGTNGGDTNNTNGGSMIAYIFHDVEGYSKFSTYTGNGSADGPFVFTGFRPAWVLIKNTARSADWRLHDIARQPENDEGGHILLPNSSSAEVTSEYDIDFLSNGFKLRSGDVYENGDGELISYAAFAEQPFKYANAK